MMQPRWDPWVLFVRLDPWIPEHLSDPLAPLDPELLSQRRLTQWVRLVLCLLVHLEDQSVPCFPEFPVILAPRSDLVPPLGQ